MSEDSKWFYLWFCFTRNDCNIFNPSLSGWLHRFNPLWGCAAVFTLRNMENMTTGTNVASRLGRFALQRQHRRATKTASNTALLCQRKCSQNGPKILPSKYLCYFFFASCFHFWILLSSADLPNATGRDFLHFCHYIHWMGLGCRVFPGTWTQSHNDFAIRLNN